MLSLRLTILLVLCLILMTAEAQEVREGSVESVSELITLTNQHYGADDLLYNGRKYNPLHANAKGHPYFNQDKWSEGQIFILGRIFDGQKIKYDIEIDRFIFFAELSGGISTEIVLNYAFTDSVKMEGRTFVKAGALPIPDSIFTYCEPVFSGDISMVATYYKEFSADYQNRTSGGIYSEQKKRLFVVDGQKISKVSTKKSFLGYFNRYKKDLRKFMNRNRIRYSKATKDELNRVMKYCNDLRKENK